MNSLRTRAIFPSLLHSNVLCKNCKYYNACEETCRKFGKPDVVTGKVDYEYALNVRYNPEKCGGDAKHFDQNHYKLITVPYYFVLKNSFYIPILTISVGYVAMISVIFRH